MRAPAGLLATLAAAIMLGGCASISTPGPPSPTHAVTGNPSVGVTAKSVVIGGTGRPTPSSTRDQVSSWWYGGGQGQANWISSDLGNIDGFVKPTVAGSDCTSLSTDVSRAQSYAPIPDAQAQHHWSAALDKYRQAATDCKAGVATTNATLMIKANAEILAGTSELNAATARIVRLINGG
ncbi:hypothetical protein [Streptacidiphilus rugosus]|uniref:hypothetical protein n=1 Tax=Streptacidiphilus rugosus TaxID=405783 RepID=UPI00056BC0BB|nr:hypothetical protein [Streptacidiphilus rugosus]